MSAIAKLVTPSEISADVGAPKVDMLGNSGPTLNFPVKLVHKGNSLLCDGKKDLVLTFQSNALPNDFNHPGEVRFWRGCFSIKKAALRIQTVFGGIAYIAELEVSFLEDRQAAVNWETLAANLRVYVGLVRRVNETDSAKQHKVTDTASRFMNEIADHFKCALKAALSELTSAPDCSLTQLFHAALKNEAHARVAQARAALDRAEEVLNVALFSGERIENMLAKPND